MAYKVVKEKKKKVKDFSGDQKPNTLSNLREELSKNEDFLTKTIMYLKLSSQCHQTLSPYKRENPNESLWFLEGQRNVIQHLELVLFKNKKEEKHGNS